jgi:hypothetical protein
MDYEAGEGVVLEFDLHAHLFGDGLGDVHVTRRAPRKFAPALIPLASAGVLSTGT